MIAEYTSSSSVPLTLKEPQESAPKPVFEPLSWSFPNRLELTFIGGVRASEVGFCEPHVCWSRGVDLCYELVVLEASVFHSIGRPIALPFSIDHIPTISVVPMALVGVKIEAHALKVSMS
ncbi:hypothetical protein HAX54_033648 [Datura stramonium]|uniref:Uncharacterized protein n=1 Tax=Datura stramonium TaxID=4076 RepID=A0ABS8SDP6_DATST|nr:hypothetical protein [Datura stramonium]